MACLIYVFPNCGEGISLAAECLEALQHYCRNKGFEPGSLRVTKTPHEIHVRVFGPLDKLQPLRNDWYEGFGTKSVDGIGLYLEMFDS